MDLKDRIYEILDSQKLAVFSTVNDDGKPQSALLGFGNNHNLELIFGTDMNTRKAQNLKSNTSIAAVVNANSECLQYEGNAIVIVGEELKQFQKIFFEKIPNLAKYAELQGQVYFKVTPTWIRLIDHNFSPGKISELTFE